jgi:isopenicillin-N N-acyltransferase-like protein
MIRMKTILKIFGGFLILLLLLFLLFLWRINISVPKVNASVKPSSFSRKQIAKDSYRVNNCWLKKNEYGIWEMYLEGNAYQRGVIYGVLAKELIEKKESDFVNQINNLVPNKIYQLFLKGFVAWFNRDIDKYIPEENLEEIYGISLSFSDKYDYIGGKYARILNYHAAHDIGHALNDFSLIGCTSFAVNRSFSADSSLLIARNFDFYLGDEFASDKLLLFVNPDSGFKFASYSWAGFTGVVSGMNEKGLTVTINASKSDIPYDAKEPISILAREILQYAKNISEAVAIAKKRETFVSESLLIGSAADNKAVIIEKSPLKTDVFSSSSDLVVCSNHYQGELFAGDSMNVDNIRNSDSKYRFERMSELIAADAPLNYLDAIAILRNKQGMGNKNIGYGNPKSINQLIAHHSIVFKPKEEKMWVSTEPCQLGEFVCYDLNAVFSKDTGYIIRNLNAKQDPFMRTDEFSKYEAYKKIKQKIKLFALAGGSFVLDEKTETDFIHNNPDTYTTYDVLGDYYFKIKNYEKAKKYFAQALNCDVASQNEINHLRKNIEMCDKRLSR